MSVTLLCCCPLCLVLCGRVNTCAGPTAAHKTGTKEQLRPRMRNCHSVCCGGKARVEVSCEVGLGSDSQGRESWQEALTSIDGARELLERRQLATVTRMSLPGGLGAWRVGGKSRGELPGPISSPSPAQLAEL